MNNLTSPRPFATQTSAAPDGCAPLDAMFAPASVALIGASAKPGSVGRALAENLLGFPGAAYFINPQHAELLSRRCYPEIGSVPGPVDLAIIATPAPTVPGCVRECARNGVRSAIIISAGFREVGLAGRELEQQVLAAAAPGGLRLLGPNCLGAMIPHRDFNGTFARGMAETGSVAFLSQSGALCSAVLDWSLREHVGFSAFVSVGAMLDVSWGDLLHHFGRDPHTRSIVCYMESIGDAPAFLAAARVVARNKPIIVLKVGHTEAAARAASSHTGALTGSDAVLDAAFRRVGVLRVNTIAEMFHLAELLSKQPLPPGPRLAILTNAGGPGALATDMLVTHGAELAPLTVGTRERLNSFLPPHWSHDNPVDLLGDASAARYARALECVASDATTDGVLVILTPQAMTESTATAEAMKSIAYRYGKPLLASWMGGAGVEGARACLNAAGIPTFDFPDTAARAFALMWRYSNSRRSLAGATDTTEVPATPPSIREAAHQFIETRRQAGRTLLTEVEAKQLLALYGIPTVTTQVAKTVDEAVQLAESLGFPVVLKLHSETLTHKTDVGGVHLDLRDAPAVRCAWHSIADRVSERAGAQHFLGVTVQPMIRLSGYELILGSSVDPQFGPVLLFGAGGQLVEVLHDTVVGLPPMDPAVALEWMRSTRIFTALQGVRGRPPVDLNALKLLLVRFSQLVTEQPWIAEIDINPLLASAEQLLALDARVVLHPSSTPEASLPRPALTHLSPAVNRVQ